MHCLHLICQQVSYPGWASQDHHTHVRGETHHPLLNGGDLLFILTVLVNSVGSGAPNLCGSNVLRSMYSPRQILSTILPGTGGELGPTTTLLLCPGAWLGGPSALSGTLPSDDSGAAPTGLGGSSMLLAAVAHGSATPPDAAPNNAEADGQALEPPPRLTPRLLVSGTQTFSGGKGRSGH